MAHRAYASPSQAALEKGTWSSFKRFFTGNSNIAALNQILAEQNQALLMCVGEMAADTREELQDTREHLQEQVRQLQEQMAAMRQRDKSTAALIDAEMQARHAARNVTPQFALMDPRG